MRTRYCKDTEEGAAFVCRSLGMPSITHDSVGKPVCVFSITGIMSVYSYSEDLIESRIKCLLFY